MYLLHMLGDAFRCLNVIVLVCAPVVLLMKVIEWFNIDGSILNFKAYCVMPNSHL
jgi:hypothetical protein